MGIWLTSPSTALEWPTLTTQWFPDVKDVKDKNFTVHRLLLGTHTAEGKPNHLQIAEVEIPKTVEPNPQEYDEGELVTLESCHRETGCSSSMFCTLFVCVRSGARLRSAARLREMKQQTLVDETLLLIRVILILHVDCKSC